MSFDKSAFASEMLDRALWWRYSVEDGKECFELSDALQALFEKPVVHIQDLTGQYTTPLLPLKIQEVLTTPDKNTRFVASYNTLEGKQSFQHRLRVFESDGVRYVWAICIDVSEMVELEREMVDSQGRLSVNQLYERQALLEQQNRFINESYQKQSRFLAMLSHELRSPLLGISSLVERLQEKSQDKALGAITNPETLTALRTIHMTAEQSIFLVNDILTYSQTEYDEITLHPMPFSLKEVLENVKQLTKSIATDKGLIISMVYLGKRDRVIGDSVRISQILINLIVNSLKFTQFGGVSIEVSEKANNHFMFKVTDSGEGISKDKQDRIFEPFAQLESRGSSFNIGSGLGLFVVKQLVELMGGEISVTSNLGVGTSFYVDLELGEADEMEAGFAGAMDLDHITSTSTEKDVLSESRAHYKILVADDSKINRMVLAGYLQEQACTVFEAKDGREAWEIFQEEPFDYVFLDIQMPFFDGIEVSQKIQQSIAQNPQLAKQLKGVYAITAGGEESNFIPEGESLASIGFDGWFVKPVTQSQIIGLLQEHKEPIDSIRQIGHKDSAEKSQKPLQLEKSVANSVKNDVAANGWDTVEKVPAQFSALMDAFMIEIESGLADLQSYNQSKNWFALAAKAHYLKGNCMLFQLDNTVSLLREIENIEKNEKNAPIKQQKIDLLLEKLEFGLKYLEKSMTIGHNGNQ